MAETPETNENEVEEIDYSTLIGNLFLTPGMVRDILDADDFDHDNYKHKPPKKQRSRKNKES